MAENWKTIASGERYRIIQGDCQDVMRDTAIRPNLIFADPPFNVGKKYDGYVDRRTNKEFRQWVISWTKLAYTILDDDGVLVLHGPDALADIWIPLLINERWRRIAWVNWYYSFGQWTDRNWIDSRCHAFVIRKGGGNTWNPIDVMIKSERLKMGDKRVKTSRYKGMRLPGTVWGVQGDEELGVPDDTKGMCRIQGNNRERERECSNQLPEAYLKRFILAYTNTGDLVFDPFCGSGTTAKVAVETGRDVVTCDVSENSCRVASDRVKRMLKESPEILEVL
ncbi:DNA adenine methyltransferase YhdJ [Thalassoglobus neptunius]|uniref:Methyltransferase n=1 Tax=Thalassoglobus neptunius TaxID=1938619 RepID=A0A5C5X7R8_9PLAN|nr:site-specific DNA-methyltransferase [Thalassoglobus neptunius]TWT59000.1 DNA adenine methyltransferase YhdJ [Thalassoglobus neptunius]